MTSTASFFERTQQLQAEMSEATGGLAVLVQLTDWMQDDPLARTIAPEARIIILDRLSAGVKACDAEAERVLQGVRALAAEAGLPPIPTLGDPP